MFSGRTQRDVRLVLVDLVNPDPFHPYPVDLYPFVQGLAHRYEIPVRWIRLAVDAPPSDLCPDLSEEQVERIAAVLRREGATHVLCNVKLRPEALERLTQARPGLSARSIDTTLALLDPGAMWLVAEWIGVARRLRADLPARHGPLDVVAPDYAALDLDDATRGRRRVTEIHSDPLCAYRKPVADNPHYAGLDLEEPELAKGCAFCMVPDDGVRIVAARPLDFALRQIEAAAQRDTGQREYLISSDVIFMQLRRFFDRIFALELPPSVFLFSCRIDELLRNAAAIRAVLPRLASAGHAMAIQRIGVENFSAVENERFNKGITSEQIEAALDLVEELPRVHPDTFLFRQYGGFGFILFTPWTTLDDLEINLDMARRLDPGEQRLMFSSQLQLRPGRPITQLARRDGLVVDAHEDHPFFSGCIHYWDEEEVPWRFAHPEVAPVHAIVRRLSDSADIPDDDELRARVETTLLRLPVDCLDRLTLVALLIEGARSIAEPTVDALLRQLLHDARARVQPGSARDPAPRTAEGPIAASSLVAALHRLCKSKPESLHGFALAGVNVSVPEVRITMERSSELLHRRDATAKPRASAAGDSHGVPTPERLVLALTPRRPGEGYSYRTGRYHLNFSAQPPSISQEAAATTKRIGRLLERVPAAAD